MGWASMNAARCLEPAAADGEYGCLRVYMVAPVGGVLVSGAGGRTGVKQRGEER